MEPYMRIFRVATDPLAGWKRELWEWLIAPAAVAAWIWIFRAVGRVVFGVAIDLSLFR
jgi:hypothetical protein